MSVSDLKSILTLNPDTFLELFEVYIDVSVGYLYLHAGKNFDKSIFFQGREYLPCPIEFEGSEQNSAGSSPRPTIKIANIDSVVTKYIKNKDNLNKSRVTRKKVMLQNIDDVNFPRGLNPFWGYINKFNESSGYGKEYFKEFYIIAKKKLENKYQVELELASPLDLENLTLPARKINDNLCDFFYRGEGCCYGSRINFAQLVGGGTTEFGGIPIADGENKTFTTDYGLNLSNRGQWQIGVNYVPGNYVDMQLIFAYDFEGEIVQESSNDGIKSVFVCLKSHTSSADKNPKLNREYWVQDECAKNIYGCRLRWEINAPRWIDRSSITLPYGGFPGTRPYEYRT